MRWTETSLNLETHLNGILIDRYLRQESAGYPTICKGRYKVDGEIAYALERPTSLNSLPILPELMQMGVAAIKIEGRQRSPAYVADVTAVMRAAIDACKADPGDFKPRPEWMEALAAVSEGRQTTLGAYAREWQ